MEFKSVEEIIDYAMEKEQEAADFYEQAKDDKNYQAINDLLTDFAAEEIKHYTMLKNLKGEGGKLKSYTLHDVTDLKISDYMTEIIYKPGLSYQDMLHVAMKREEEAYKFYKALIDKTDNEELKNVFQVLAQEESKHKLKLETWYDDFLVKQDM